MAVAQQYVFEINKDETKNQKCYGIQENNFYDALLNIHTIGALKLFLFLSKNKNEFTWTLYRQKFMELTKLNTNTVTNAIKELKEIGYVIPISEKGFHCLFYDNLNKAKEVAKEMQVEKTIKEEKAEMNKGFYF